MKSKIFLLLFIFGVSFAFISCRDRVDLKDLIDRLKDQDNDNKKFDCPDLKLNFKDACKTGDGKVGYIDRDCNCTPKETDKRFDCPDLKLNFKDACKTRDGKVGYVDANSNCATKNTDDKSYDCPRLKLNFKDQCKTANGTVGYVDKDCNCIGK